jgi:hypothetical protein
MYEGGARGQEQGAAMGAPAGRDMGKMRRGEPETYSARAPIGETSATWRIRRWGRGSRQGRRRAQELAQRGKSRMAGRGPRRGAGARLGGAGGHGACAGRKREMRPWASLDGEHAREEKNRARDTGDNRGKLRAFSREEDARWKINTKHRRRHGDKHRRQDFSENGGGTKKSARDRDHAGAGDKHNIEIWERVTGQEGEDERAAAEKSEGEGGLEKT